MNRPHRLFIVRSFLPLLALAAGCGGLKAKPDSRDETEIPLSRETAFSKEYDDAPEQEKKVIAGKVAYKWAGVDEDAAVAWARTLDEDTRMRIVEPLIRGSTFRNPRSLLRFAAGLKEKYKLEQAFGKLTDLDFPLAVSEALAMPDQSMAAEYLAKALRSWMGTESLPWDAIGTYPAIRDPALRLRIASTLGTAVGEKSHHDTEQRMNAFADPGEQAAFLSAYLRAKAGRDPQAAATVIRALPPSRREAKDVTMVVELLAGRDFDQAIQLALSWEEGEVRNTMIARAIGAAAATDPQSVAGYLSAIPAGETRLFWIGILSSEWLTADRESAWQWVLTLNSVDRGAAVVPFARSNLPVGPELASMMADAVRDKPDGPVLGSATAAMTSRWLKTDRNVVLAWVAALPAGTVRETAAKQAMETLCAEDKEPFAVDAWIRGLPADTARDQLLHAGIPVVRRWDVPTCFAWVLLQSPESPTRTKDLAEASFYWRGVNAEDFRAAVLGMDLSAEDRKSALSR